MSFSFSRDRTAEIRDSYDEGRRSSDDFGPARQPAGYRSPPMSPQRAPQSYNQSYDSPRHASPAPPPPQHQGREYRGNANRHESYEMNAMTPSNDVDSMQGFFDEIEYLKREITTINQNVDDIENLHTSALVSYNEHQWNQMATDLENLKSETQRRNQDIKNRIKGLDTANLRLPNDSNGQMRRTQVDAVRKRFMETIQRYQDIERSYRQKYRQRVERQIRIVKPEATEQEIDQWIDSDDSPQIFAQSLMQTSRRGQARAVLSEVQTRHDDIKKIEKTIVELHQLFMDMQMLVEQQGEVITQIDQHAEQTQQDLEKGNTFITKAIKSAKATRAEKMVLFLYRHHPMCRHCDPCLVVRF
ncbi:t-SNARE [Radiomyces spectabilis]|uniref:t-SNARE n=1 Tax=Radiomyces spectabilis TaxID=64574 RepID=UPI00221E4DAD|nr:t-SNARE [Radiomyces spectabilis]KAI8374159.1 t-SNARE [Radiomyces spectabilis]